MRQFEIYRPKVSCGGGNALYGVVAGNHQKARNGLLSISNIMRLERHHCGWRRGRAYINEIMAICYIIEALKSLREYAYIIGYDVSPRKYTIYGAMHFIG